MDVIWSWAHHCVGACPWRDWVVGDWVVGSNGQMGQKSTYAQAQVVSPFRKGHRATLAMQDTKKKVPGTAMQPCTW